MYNLTVAEAHTYYVGDGQWLVHNCYENLLSGNLANELRIAQNLGVKPVYAGTAEFDALVATGQPMKYVILQDGTTAFIPSFVDGYEISHAVASGGRPVQAAGTINLAGSNGSYWVTDLTNNSGHYQPAASSLTTASEILTQNGFNILPDAITPYIPYKP